MTGNELLPPACTLGPDDGPARLRRWQRLRERAAPTARVGEGELEVRFRGGPEVRRELEELAAAEQECCSFVSWAVADDDGHAVLHVTAPPGAPHLVEPVVAMFHELSAGSPPAR